jgi:hypothetical protein
MNPKPASKRVNLLVGSLLGANLLLSGALAFAALRPRAVVVVPGVRENQIALPEEVPPAALRKFARLYLVLFDDYTPETVEDRSTDVLRLVAPEAQEKVRRDLVDRATYVVRTRESSHLILPPPGQEEVERLPGRLFQVSLSAERQVYIASEGKGSSRVRYTLTLRSAFPSDGDAFGFVVAGQSIRAETSQATAEGNGDRHD